MLHCRRKRFYLVSCNYNNFACRACMSFTFARTVATACMKNNLTLGKLRPANCKRFEIWHNHVKCSPGYTLRSLSTQRSNWYIRWACRDNGWTLYSIESINECLLVALESQETVVSMQFRQETTQHPTQQHNNNVKTCSWWGATCRYH